MCIKTDVNVGLWSATDTGKAKSAAYPGAYFIYRMFFRKRRWVHGSPSGEE